MSNSGNNSNNGKRRKSSKTSNGYSNGHNKGNSNGDSALAPLLHYEQTKIESITKELEEAQANYQDRVDRLKKKKLDFKQDYKTQIEVYKKVVALKKEGLSGNISEESTYVRIKEEFEKFQELDQAIEKYKQEAVNVLTERKQSLLQTITDARRKRQVELIKQEQRSKKEKSRNPGNPEVLNPQSPSLNINPNPNDSGITPGGSGTNVELLEKELSRENQINRAHKLIDYYESNKRVLESAHDQYEDRLNSASNAYEAQLYNYHVARVQKWIHILDNRINLYTQILADENVLEEYDKIHDDGYDAPTDLTGFELRPMVDLYKGIYTDRIRKHLPKDPDNLSGHSSPHSGNTNPTPTPTPSSSGHTTPPESGHSTPDPNMANKWKYYRDIPKFVGAPGEMGQTHLTKLSDMFKIFEIQVPNDPTAGAPEIIDLFRTSLNGPARNWYDLNVTGENMGERTVEDWEAIKTKFLRYYNPAGSTIEQQMTTLDTLKWHPLTETIDQFAYKFRLMYKNSFGEDYTCAIFKKSLPNEYRERLMGVNTFNDIIQRVKEVQQFLGQNIPPPAQWPAYGMPQWAGQTPQGTYPYPYGMMYPQQPPQQNPMGYPGTVPFPPQGQNTGPEKMNFMAAKSVSFAPQLETTMVSASGMKDALSDIAGEICALKSRFAENLDAKLMHVRDELKNSSELRIKDELADFIHVQNKVMDRKLERLIDAIQAHERDLEREKDKLRSRDRERYKGGDGNRQGYNSYRNHRDQDQSRSPSGDRYGQDRYDRNRYRSSSRSPGRYDRDYRDNDRNGNYRRDRSYSRERYENQKNQRNGQGNKYNPNIICNYCQGKGHIQAKCFQLEKDLKMGKQKIKDMTIEPTKDKAFFLTEEKVEDLIKKIYKEALN